MPNCPFCLCLLLTLCTLSLSDDVFVSIDCRSSSTSAENGITWTGDDKYVKGGESHSVQTGNSSSSLVLDTLRVFTNKTKNCYNIDSFKQGRVLLRATFHYGNYDGNNSPPRFDLMFDGNCWARVDTSGPMPALYEVIYVTKKNSISVCVSQIEEGQFPFISALEVRSLESYMYRFVEDGIPLFTRRRVAFGSNHTIRFPDDPYDRLWNRDRFLPDGAIQVSSDALLSNGMLLNTADKPPPAVLKTAIISPSPNSPIDLFMGFPSFNVSFYITGTSPRLLASTPIKLVPSTFSRIIFPSPLLLYPLSKIVLKCSSITLLLPPIPYFLLFPLTTLHYPLSSMPWKCFALDRHLSLMAPTTTMCKA